PLTAGIESGLWPTPVANDDNKSPEAHLAMKARMKGGPRKTITSLQVMVKATERGMWPTPTVDDSNQGENARKSGAFQSLSRAVKYGVNGSIESDTVSDTPGSLNPTWVEWLMGFPLGWTVCEAWATRSSRKSPKS